MNQSWSTPSADIDHMLNHVSNQMAKSQLFRRLSANSNNSSPGRRSNTRVAKTHSNGATPHGVQRRRTTAAHTNQSRSRTSMPTALPQPLPQTAAVAAHRARNAELSSITRPLTWHPGSCPLGDTLEEVPRSGILDYQPYVVHQQSAFAEFTNYFPHSSLDYNTNPNTCTSATGSESFPQQAAADVATYSYPYCNPSSSYLQYGDGTPYSYDSSFADFQPLDFSQVPSDYTAYSTQHTPDTFQFQAQASAPQYVQPQLPTQITKQKSKELVGMGLYDGPSRGELSALNVSQGHVGQLLEQPQGKGLKLEETWQPPNDDDHDTEEAGYSTDEAEEDLPNGPASHETQPTVLPASCGDLSNQSFLFDSDDPYTDYVSFDPGVHIYQPKMSDAGSQNFMWL